MIRLLSLVFLALTVFAQDEPGFRPDLSDSKTFVYTVPSDEGVIVKTIYREKIAIWRVEATYLEDEDPQHTITVVMRTEGNVLQVFSITQPSVALEFFGWKMGASDSKH